MIKMKYQQCSILQYKFHFLYNKEINRQSVNIKIIQPVLNLMETSLLQYYQNGDISLMKQYLLTVPIFNQIHYYLGNDKFYSFLQSIQVYPVYCSRPFQLLAQSTYLFMSSGSFYCYFRYSVYQSQGIIIPKKQKKHNFNRLSRLSKNIKLNSHLFINKDIFNQQNQRQSQKIKTIDANSFYNQPLLYNPNYQGETHYFISNQQKKSAIIALNFNKISQQILQDLREKHNQKLKFISSSDIFKNVQKYLIQNALSKFYVLKVSFDECLLKQPNLRTTHLFFLTLGEVQICIDEGNMKKTYITKAPAIIGLQKTKLIKSVTQCCLCFYVQKSDVIEILKKNNDSKYKNAHTQQKLKCLLKSIGKDKLTLKQNSVQSGQMNRLNQMNQCNEISKYNREQMSPRYERSNTTPVSPVGKIQKSNEMMNKIQKNNYLLKPKQNIIKRIQQKVPQKKKYLIKQHFSNYLNDKYSKFAIKKQQYLKKSNLQDSVLYQMKTLKPKQPQMSQINNKLKQERLNRLIKCKQNIINTKQQNLNIVNIRIYEEFEDSKIINKIRRKIQNNINKKQRKRQQWKTYVPTTVSFNRMTDLSLGV